MSATTSIEWTDATWNPVTGCTKVSPGCDHCYAETFANRFRGTEGHYFEQGFDVQLRPDKLTLPLRWRKPRKVFVNSMSDLFHDSVPDEYIGAVFKVMQETPQHTYQILTKRHGRMRSLLSRWATERVLPVTHEYEDDLVTAVTYEDFPWPLPNVWLGVSVESQKWADIRIPALLDTPATVRFLSCEPLLGPVDLSKWLGPVDWPPCFDDHPTWTECARCIQPDWVITGGESGPGARPMHPDWARSLRDQCAGAGVPFLFKQWGEYRPPIDGDVTGAPYARVGKKAAGRLLDGRTWDEYPEQPTLPTEVSTGDGDQ